MNHSRSVRGVAAGALSSALLLLGACGGSTDTTGADGPAETSTSPTPSQGPASSSQSPDSGDAADLPELSGGEFYQAAYDAQTGAGSYHFTLKSSTPQGSLTGKGDADYSKAEPAVRSTVQSSQGAVESVVVGGYFYLKAPGLGTAKPWLKIDPNAKTGLGALVGQLGANSDPAKILASLKKPQKFSLVGAEQVDGVATNHYDVKAASARVFRALGFPEKLIKSLNAPKTFDYDIWLDKDNLPRKTVQELTVSGQKTRTEIHFSDYGDPVTVSAPPKQKTTTKSPIPSSPSSG